MVSLVVTVDVESSKENVGGIISHRRYDKDIDLPCHELVKISAKYSAKITFFFPLGEFIREYPRAVSLGRYLLEQGHDLGLHLHRPFPLLDENQIKSLLHEEKELFEKHLGVSPVAIRAGGYNIKDHHQWLNIASQVGLRIDSSVWAGANTSTTREMVEFQIAREEQRWGKGAFSFDYRHAPITGAYFPEPDDLTLPGEKGKILEIPVTTLWYDEVVPGGFRFDPQRMGYDYLVYTFERFWEHHQEQNRELFLNMMFHSNGLLRFPLGSKKVHFHSRALRNYQRFLAYIHSKYVATGKARFKKLSEVDVDKVEPYYLYSIEQPQYWSGQPTTANKKTTLDETLCPQEATEALERVFPAVLKEKRISRAAYWGLREVWVRFWDSLALVTIVLLLTLLSPLAIINLFKRKPRHES